MNTQKFLIGGIVGGIVNFFLGYLIYGKLLMDFMKKNAGTASGVDRAEDQMVWWGLIVGNLALGFLVSYVLARTNTRTLGGGFVTGAILGLFMSVGYDCIMYGVTNLMTTTGMMADIGVSIVMSGITGAVIGLVNGMGSTKTA